MRISKERKELKVVFDQVSTPTYAKDLARFIIFVIENKLYRGRQDVYHFSNEGVCSWYDFAVEILKLAGSDCKVIPCRTEDSQHLQRALPILYWIKTNSKRISISLFLTGEIL